MDFSKVLLFTHPMEYRRFGKTNKNISVITLGGMRYKHVWDEPRNHIPSDTLDECRDTVIKAFDHGINLIETAYGYKKSETVYGKVLNDELKIPRQRYFLMTKGNASSASEMRKLVEEQLTTLKTTYLDFYAWHGINNQELLQKACAQNGPVSELLKMKAEGMIGHIGFSTHAPVEIIIKAIETDLFDFVNLHYYYFFQRNKAAVDLAATKDMGVFIISPNDKGGQLMQPSKKLMDLTKPLLPAQWNARFCLGHPEVHTLSFGLPKTASFEMLDGIFPAQVPLSPDDANIKQLLDSQKLLDPYASFNGYTLQNDPSGLNIPEILRFRMLWKCYEMENFVRYRYNMFEEKGHWFPGTYPTDENLGLINLSRCPKNIPLKEMILETHHKFFIDKEKQ